MDTTPDLLFAQPTADPLLVFGAETVGAGAGAASELLFSQASASTALVFGGVGGGNGGTAPALVTARVAVALANTLEVHALGMPPVEVAGQITLAGTLSVQAGVYYDNRVTPWKEAFAAAHAQPASAVTADAGAPWGLSAPYTPTLAAPYSPALACAASAQVLQSTAQPIAAAPAAPYTLAEAEVVQAAMPAQTGAAQHRGASAPYSPATPEQAFMRGALQAGVPRQCARTHAHHRGAWHRRGWGGSMGLGRSAHRGAGLPWGLGRGPWPGKAVWPPVGPVKPPLAVSTALLFECPPLPLPFLVFGATCTTTQPPQSLLYILPARFYMSVHSVAAYLLPGLEPVPLFDLSLAADVDSTVWTFSASTPREYFDALAPTSGAPRQIKVVADAMEWVFLVDSLKQTESFGKRRASISGRSATALVGEPYSRATQRLSTTAQNARQLAEAALQYTGVGLDWGITDWLVAPGAWSHTGTPLAAVQAIAQAAGGYVLSHRAAPTLLVRHPYPLLPGGIPGGPWNWEGAAGAFAADVELAPDVILSRSVERADGAEVDGVYVAGTVTGAVEALVRRTGTMGTKLAAMQTDALITALEAAQQRGLAVLGTGGAKHKVQITMPVLVGGANPGLLDVGQLVQINDAAPWRGRVRAVQMQYTAPTLRQTVTLERHLA
ncbi:MAG: hypothetical protein ACT4NV_02945 [Rhodoferax sp.]